MTRENQSINSHIEEYLDYYCGLSHPPEFAVLLKGQWGAGKTWFINRYREKLEKNKQRCLYISLYGVTTFSEIEDKFFQLLYPIQSSKAMKVTGIILKGLLKGALKIDLDNDKQDDGTWNIQIPEINLKDLENIDESVLVFDDLERCEIKLNNILGYINHFVENQGLKVIIIANEDKLLEQADGTTSYSYKNIKEKLIGKTFTVSPDFQTAFKDFANKINNLAASNFLSKSISLLQDSYNKTKYENLRSLKQITLDFKRIFEVLPEKVKNKPEALKDLLKMLVAFSISIKCGEMIPKDISKLREGAYRVARQISSSQISSSITQAGDEELAFLQKVLNICTVYELEEPFPSMTWWEIFFDKGIIDIPELEQSILNSKYFQDENTPDWVKLFHFNKFADDADDEFDALLKKIGTEYESRKFHEIGVIKHIFGLLLKFSDAGLFHKTREEILKDSKLYIDHLRSNDRSSLVFPLTLEDAFGSYYGLGFCEEESKEFRDFSSYINEVQNLAKKDALPDESKSLLAEMINDSRKFYRMICLNNYQDEDASIQTYYDIPILIYIDSNAFVKNLLSTEYESRRWIFWALKERYKFDNFNAKLLEELEWLKSIRVLLLAEIDRRKGKLSGFSLKLLVERYLDETIKKLELNDRKGN